MLTNIYNFSKITEKIIGYGEKWLVVHFLSFPSCFITTILNNLFQLSPKTVCITTNINMGPEKHRHYFGKVFTYSFG